MLVTPEGCLQEYMREMSAVIDEDVIPEDYGGRNMVSGPYDSIQEVALRLLTERNNRSFERQRKRAGITESPLDILRKQK